MKKTVSAGLLALIVLAAAGCNIVEGVGKDVQVGGEKVQDAAERAK